MSRPVKLRKICQMPQISEFSPNKIQCENTVKMTVEEYETVRLIDLLKLSQQECAEQMGVARTTVQAIYDIARQKTADALVNGKRLIIIGGNYLLCENSARCCAKSCSALHCSKKRCMQDKTACKKCL